MRSASLALAPWTARLGRTPPHLTRYASPRSVFWARCRRTRLGCIPSYRVPRACASARGARLRCARPASTSLAVASCAICHGWPHGSAAVCCAFLIPKRSFFDVWSKYPHCAPRWGAVSLCIDERLTTSQIVSVQSCVHPCGGRLDGFTVSLRLRESLGFVRAGVDVRRAMRVF